MSRLQARVEKLEGSTQTREKKAGELVPTPEEEQAWQAWEAQGMRLNFDAMLKEIKNRQPDLEYQKLTTPHEQAQYMRRKFEAVLATKHDPVEEARLQGLRAKQKEEFIRNLRSKPY